MHLKNTSSHTPLVLGLAFLATTIRAELVGWHPDLSLTWGQGVNMRLQDKVLPPVANMSTIPIITDTGDASVAVTFAQHTFDLARSFSLNASVSAKYYAAEGSVHYNMVDDQKFSQNTLSFTYVCTRDFGTTRYTPTGVSPMLQEYVANRRGTMSSTDLQRAVDEQFGTHFVSGVRKAARVIAIYSFTFDSQAVRQSYALNMNAKYSGGVTSAAFHTDVQSVLEQHNSGISMAYQFYTTDSLAPWPIAQSGTLTNYQQFLDFTTILETYCQNLPAERAKPISYVVESVKNIPGYLTLLQSDAASPEVADYDRFLKVYAKFRAWEDLLSAWTIDTRRMSWLNTTAQQMVIDMRSDVTSYRKSLDQLAKNHFKNGAALEVSDELISYLVQLNHIPLPTINIAQIVPFIHSGSVNSRLWFGYIYAGPKSLTIDSPFQNVAVICNGSEVPPVDYEKNPASVYWDTNQFITKLLELRDVTTWITDTRALATEVLAGPILPQILEAAKTNRIGFFIVNSAPEHRSQIDSWMLGLRDPTGEFTDVWDINTSRTTPQFQSLEGSNISRITANLKSGSTLAKVGMGYDYMFGVTNSGPGGAYGITLETGIDADYEVTSVAGSQGSGTCTNGQLKYLIGALASGAEATVRLHLIPLQPGQQSLEQRFTLGLATGLTNVSVGSGVDSRRVSVQAPELAIKLGAKNPEISWTSETSRLELEQTHSLSPEPRWTPVTNGIQSAGTLQTLVCSNALHSGFYRLHLK